MESDDRNVGEKDLDRHPAGTMSEAEVDYNVMGSFPASDPPAWTLGVSPRKHYATQFEGVEPGADDPSHQNEKTG